MPKKASKKSKPAKSSNTAASGGKPKVNKSAWIRAQPADLSAADVVKKAADAGIKLSTAFVYTARSQKKGAAKKGPGRPKGSKNLKKEIAGDLTALRRAVFQHGFEKVESFLADLKKSVGL